MLIGKQGIRWVAILLATTLSVSSVLATPPQAIAQESPGEMVLKSTGRLVWFIVTGIGGTIVYIYNGAGKLIGSFQSRTVENVTKEECFQIRGSIGWAEYKRQPRNLPKQQRVGTCYVED